MWCFSCSSWIQAKTQHLNHAISISNSLWSLCCLTGCTFPKLNWNNETVSIYPLTTCDKEERYRSWRLLLACKPVLPLISHFRHICMETHRCWSHRGVLSEVRPEPAEAESYALSCCLCRLLEAVIWNLPSCSSGPLCCCGRTSPSPSGSLRPPQPLDVGKGRRQQAKRPAGRAQLTGPRRASYDTEREGSLQTMHSPPTSPQTEWETHTSRGNRHRNTSVCCSYSRSLGLQSLVIVRDQCNQFIHLFCRARRKMMFSISH